MKHSKKQSRNQLMHNLNERIKSKLKWYNILAYLLSAILSISFTIFCFASIDKSFSIFETLSFVFIISMQAFIFFYSIFSLLGMICSELILVYKKFFKKN